MSSFNDTSAINMRCRPAISSMSLGRAWVHDMRTRLEQAAQHGFEGIELFYEDLEYMAADYPEGATARTRRLAAHTIRSMCDQHQLDIICLQPFMHYEGLKDRQRHVERIVELGCWFELAHILRTDLIHIPATFLTKEQVTDDMNVIVGDLVEAADLAAQCTPPIRLAYESLAWSTYVDTWEKSNEIVERVNRSNFGICLDTFNIAGRVYADPASPSAKTPSAEADMLLTTERLLTTVNVSKIFFIQVVDAERLEAPLVQGHEYYVYSQPARMSWSRNCRLFYGEEDRGAYLPCRQLTRAIVNGLGFRGWVSMELFNRSMADPSPHVPEEHARRGQSAWGKMVRDLGLEQRVQVVPFELASNEPKVLSLL